MDAAITHVDVRQGTHLLSIKVIENLRLNTIQKNKVMLFVSSICTIKQSLQDFAGFFSDCCLKCLILRQHLKKIAVNVAMF